MAEVTIVDYGVGNIRAFASIYQRLNVSVEIATTAGAIVDAKRLVLPGVGAFDWAMKKLDESGMRDALDVQVMDHKTPVIGVCVGMQMMAKTSDEGKLSGLGWLDAHVEKLTQVSNQSVPLPHMGWNDVIHARSDNIFDRIVNARFYFLHSYIFVPQNAGDILTETQYGKNFVSSVRQDNIYGTQFHPEKSHQWGISLLANFAMLKSC